ncbi:MAG TPA: hypothetical protein VFL57_01740 [Bryobacteraceae bacterium]|nr:hypothetical protein [Bryobacteraceae bacterium]
MWWREYWWTVLIAILATPVVATAVFAHWLRRRPGLDVDAGVKCWDVFIKLISAFTVIVSGAMLFGKYIDQQQDLHEREAHLRQAEFLRQKLQFETERHQRNRMLLDEAKTLAARLANVGTDAASLRRFEELYFAALIGVEQPGGPVEAAMVRFRRKLRNEAGAPAESLDQLALALSRACETELKQSQDALLAQHKTIADLVRTDDRGKIVPERQNEQIRLGAASRDSGSRDYPIPQ